MSDTNGSHATPEDHDESSTAVGNTSDETQELLDDETTDENGMPLENPAGG